jgi:V/A-type H+-transporting ATPase subunit C
MRALKGRLLEQAQMESLLMSPDIQSFMSILNQTDYVDHVQNLTDPTQIEHGLKQNLILTYIKILTFLSGKPARFVATLLERFELINVKSIIRSLMREANLTDTSAPFMFSLRKYHTIPIESVLEARDLESFMKLMKNTQFARSLEIGYQHYEAEKSSLPLEIALDLGYYARLQESFDSLGLIDKGKANEFLRMQYDIINLVWMLRFKEYYRLSPEQIFQYIIPNGWKIQGQVFWKIIGSSDMLGSIKEHFVHPYDHVLESITPVDDNSILGVELALLRYLYHQSLKALQGFPFHIASFIGFFVMKEMEIKDIMTIMDGKNLELSQDRIKKHLVILK